MNPGPPGGGGKRQRMTYEDIIDEILLSEGSTVNEADGVDADGTPIPSKFGVLQTTLNWFHRVNGSGIPMSVYDLTDADAREFYKWWIGERSGAMDCPSWFSYMLADFYTQSGGWAIKVLQRKVGVDADGAWGPDTKVAVQKMFDKIEGDIADNPHADNEFVRWYDSERRAFIQSLNLPEEKGILARLDKVLRITLEQVEKNDTLPKARPIVEIEVPAEFQRVKPESESGFSGFKDFQTPVSASGSASDRACPNRGLTERLTSEDEEHGAATLKGKHGAPQAGECLPYRSCVVPAGEIDNFLCEAVKEGYVLSTVVSLQSGAGDVLVVTCLNQD